MSEIQSHAAFSVYVICAVILVFKMILVGHYTGLRRIVLKTYLNPEDAKAFSQIEETQSQEDPEIDRGLRAHRNDLESTLPFLIMAPLYLLTQPSAAFASWLFIVFTGLRVVFSVFYLRAMQPWRSLTFLAAEVCLVVMLVQTLRGLAQ